MEQNVNRTKKAKKNIIAMIGIKGLMLGVSFLYIPLLLHTLDTVNYGIWLTLTSIVVWIGMFDIGLGNGLRNKLSEALARNDIKRGRELVSTAYGCIFAFIGSVSIIFISVYRFLPWNEILGATDKNIDGLDSLVLIVVLSFCLQFALGLLNSILFALQHPAISSLITMLGQLISFCAVYLMAKVFEINSLFVLGSVISVIPPTVLLISSIIIFTTKYRYLSPSVFMFRKLHILSIFSIGIKFFFLTIITLVLYQTNNLIITHTVNSAAVVDYNISYKLVHILPMIFGIICTPIWSATTEAYTLGDLNWIKRINRKLLKIANLFTLGGIALIAVSPYIYQIWLGKNDLNIQYSTTSLIFLQATFFIYYQCYGYILNGIGKLKAQLVFTSVLAILYIPVAIMLGKLWGLNGVLIAFVLNAMFNVLWSKIQYGKIIKGTASGIWNQ